MRLSEVDAGSEMQATIANILTNPDRYADQILYIDGILLITDYDRNTAQFEQVWLVKQDAAQNRAIRAQPISSASTLWHGLSRLNPRHLPGYQSYRIHDAVRACVHVLGTAQTEADPLIRILTVAVYRHEFTLYVGEQGVRLDQALPARSPIRALPDIRGNIARYLGRRVHVYGTLVIRSTPPAQYLLPGRIPYSSDFLSTVNRLGSGDVDIDWLSDIEYPQSDNGAAETDALPQSLHIDQEYPIQRQLSVLPGINQTIVKPAIVDGILSARDQDQHFATLTDIESAYLQNVYYGELGKSLESVIKLKNFEDFAREI